VVVMVVVGSARSAARNSASMSSKSSADSVTAFAPDCLPFLLPLPMSAQRGGP
jgi:hypothetical protein